MMMKKTWTAQVQIQETRPSVLQIACHRAAKSYPGGISAIAQDYGFNAHTFQNKLNPNEPNCINLKEFEAICRATKSQLIIDALAELLSQE